MLLKSYLIRLVVFLLAIAIFGGGSIVVNYYVHKIDSEAIDHYLVLSIRTMLPQSLTNVLREAIRVGNKNYIYHSNTSATTGMTLFDIIDDGRDNEAKLIDYDKFGTRTVFRQYFAMKQRLDSAELCSIVDSAQWGQSGSKTIFAILKTCKFMALSQAKRPLLLIACATDYIGPKAQGLTDGIKFVIDTHEKYGRMTVNTNFSDSVQAASIRAETMVTQIATYGNSFLNPMDDLMITLYLSDITAFHSLINSITMAKSVTFAVVFCILYLVIFIKFMNLLWKELSQCEQLPKLVPSEVLQLNKRIVQWLE